MRIEKRLERIEKRQDIIMSMLKAQNTAKIGKVSKMYCMAVGHLCGVG